MCREAKRAVQSKLEVHCFRLRMKKIPIKLALGKVMFLKQFLKILFSFIDCSKLLCFLFQNSPNAATSMLLRAMSVNIKQQQQQQQQEEKKIIVLFTYHFLEFQAIH